MPRPPRIELPGGVHHVTARAPSGRVFFRDVDDRRTYLAILAEHASKQGWHVLSYCQMTNHVHLLLETPRPTLTRGMKALHERFARFVNTKYAESGHLLGRRFWNGPVVTERHLFGCFRYIARNPVAANLCARPDEWEWSAHRSLAGLTPAPEFLAVSRALELLGAEPADYARLANLTDLELLDGLRKAAPKTWPAVAVDDFALPIEAIATFAGIGERAAYKRLAAARAAVREGPSSVRGLAPE